MSGNHYRNPLKTPWLARIIFVCVTLAAIFASFVILRNRQVKQGDKIREAEFAIVEREKRIRDLESKIAGLLDRNEMELRIEFIRSPLVPIRQSQILEIDPKHEVPALPKVASNE